MRNSLAAPALATVLATTLSGIAQQQPAATTAPANAPSAAADPKSAPKPRVYVTESDSWQASGGSGGGAGSFGGGFSGGASPQTAEVVKTIGQRCPEIIVNNRVDASDYVIRLEHEGGKGLLRHKDKVAVFARKSGDAVFSASTLSVGGAVQDSCAAITADWAAHSTELSTSSPAPISTPATQPAATPSAASATLTVESSVPGADIEVDGSFVGSTPSTLSVTPGQHVIAVKKKGYTDWTRTMNVSGTAVRLSADLEKSGS